MKLRCKSETLNDDGSKIMEFTKGEIYYAHKMDDEVMIIKSDDGTDEEFFNTDIMFERLN